MKPVALPPGRARLSTKPAPTGSGTIANTIGTVRVACTNGPTAAEPFATTTSGGSAVNSAACLRISSVLPPAQRTSIRILRRWPSPVAAALVAMPQRGLRFRIVRGESHEHADAPHPLRPLRARGKRPCGRRAAEQGDERAPPHSITSSARARRVAGKSRPIAFAALRLMTSSNFVGCSTGKSAGFDPLRILSTKVAARR
jgi:hypothetical protein